MEPLKKGTNDALNLNFLEANISCSMFQVIVMIALVVAQGIIPILSGLISRVLGGVSPNLKVIIDFIPYLIFAVVYGTMWFRFWTGLYKDGIRWFYWRIVFSIIPLIGAVILINPRPDPASMNILPLESIFNSLVTGTILLPIYSVFIYKFILRKPLQRVKNTVIVCIITLLIGAPIYYKIGNFMTVLL